MNISRPVEGGMISGVCAGLARHLNMDVTVMRIIWVLAVVLGGFGVLLYCIFWVIMPRESDGATLAQEWFGDKNRG